MFTLSKPSMIPFLQYAKNRDLREQIYRGYFMRGNNDNKNDNKETISKIVKLRVEKARLLGFDSYAAYGVDGGKDYCGGIGAIQDFAGARWVSVAI